MTTEEKALALVNKVQAERNCPISKRMGRGVYSFDEALCRAIEAHEADKKAFSDAAYRAVRHMDKSCFNQGSPMQVEREDIGNILSPFIIPDPEPDPLVEVSDAIGVHRITLEQALAARGYKIERIEQ